MFRLAIPAVRWLGWIKCGGAVGDGGRVEKTYAPLMDAPFIFRKEVVCRE